MAQWKILIAVTTSAIFQKSIKTEKHRSAPVVCLL